MISCTLADISEEMSIPQSLPKYMTATAGKKSYLWLALFVGKEPALVDLNFLSRDTGAARGIGGAGKQTLSLLTIAIL